MKDIKAHKSSTTLSLAAHDRAALEIIGVRLGLRSLSETARYLIRAAARSMDIGPEQIARHIANKEGRP